MTSSAVAWTSMGSADNDPQKRQLRRRLFSKRSQPLHVHGVGYDNKQNNHRNHIQVVKQQGFATHFCFFFFKLVKEKKGNGIFGLMVVLVYCRNFHCFGIDFLTYRNNKTIHAQIESTVLKIVQRSSKFWDL